MKVKGQFEYLGINEITGKEEKKYYSASFLQESEVQKVYLDDKSKALLTGYKKMDPVEVELNINIGAKTYVSLVSVKACSKAA